VPGDCPRRAHVTSGDYYPSFVLYAFIIEPHYFGYAFHSQSFLPSIFGIFGLRGPVDGTAMKQFDASHDISKGCGRPPWDLQGQCILSSLILRVSSASLTFTRLVTPYFLYIFLILNYVSFPHHQGRRVCACMREYGLSDTTIHFGNYR
jgi:hypothetical protein